MATCVSYSSEFPLLLPRHSKERDLLSRRPTAKNGSRTKPIKMIYNDELVLCFVLIGRGSEIQFSSTDIRNCEKMRGSPLLFSSFLI